MLEKKLFYGGMDSDTEDRLLQQGDYRSALNVRNSIPDKAEVGSLPSVKGNLLVPYTLPGGTNKIIGHYDDLLNKRAFSFLYNSTGDHQILIHNTITGVRSKLIGNTLLNFDLNYLVLHVDVIEDLLMWTDNNNEPCAILISKAQTGFYDTVTSRQYFDAIAYPLKFSPICNYVSDDSYQQNNIRGKLFQFRTTFVDEMNRESAASPISKIPIPISESLYLPDGNYQTYINNKIEVGILDTGIDMVKKINVYVREGNTGDWYLAKSLIKSELSISNNTGYNFEFYNDEAWIPVGQPYINRLFDFIPQKAQCQSLLANKRIDYTNILEGYDNIVTDCTVEAVYSEIVPIDSTVQAGNYYNILGQPVFVLTGSPSTTAAVNSTGVLGVVLPLAIVFDINTIDTTQVFNLEYTTSLYSTQFVPFASKTVTITDNYTGNFPVGTTSLQVATYFANLINNSTVVTGSSNGFTYTTNAIVALQSGNNYGIAITTTYTAFGGTAYIPQSASNTLQSSINSSVLTPSLKTGSWYKVGLTYHDEADRSGTVQFSPTMDLKIDPYSSHPLEIGPVTGRININHTPPSWAKYYQVVITENLSKVDYIQIKTGTVQAVGTNYKIYINTIATYNGTYPNAFDFVYGFSKGDRLVLLKDSSSNVITNYIDVEILSSDTDTGGQFIVVSNTISVTPQSNSFIEIYTPKQTVSEQLFYEIGEVFPIENGYHTGDIQNQSATNPATVEFTGDCYFKFRPGNMGFFVEDKSLSDFYESESWDKGRPNRIDVESKQIRRDSTTYYSEAYVPETNLNGLSVIYDTSFESGDIKYGSIQRTYSDDDRIEFYYELKTAWRLVGKSILYDAQGNPNITKSDKVLSDESFYEGEYGIGKNPESFAYYENQRYHVDANRGVVCRLTSSGYDAISKYQMIRYFSDLFKTRVNFGEPFNVWGVFDIDHKEYTLCFEEVTNEVEVLLTDTIFDGVTTSTASDIPLGDTSIIAMGGASEGVPAAPSPEEADIRAAITSGSISTTTPVVYTLSPVTISFSNEKNRWVEEYGFYPDCIGAVNIGVVSYKAGALYVHDANPVYNNFYGVQHESKLTFVSNQEPSVIKVFQDIYTESTHPWSLVATTKGGQLTSLETTDYEEIEWVFYAALLKDANTPVTDPLINGDDMRGNAMEITLTNTETTQTNLFAVNVRHVRSMLTNV